MKAIQFDKGSIEVRRHSCGYDRWYYGRWGGYFEVTVPRGRGKTWSIDVYLPAVRLVDADELRGRYEDRDAAMAEIFEIAADREVSDEEAREMIGRIAASFALSLED